MSAHRLCLDLHPKPHRDISRDSAPSEARAARWVPDDGYHPPAAKAGTAPAGGQMEIVLPGGAVVRVGADVDGAALRRVLVALASP